MTAAKRATVRLTEGETEDLEKLKDPEHPYSMVIGVLTGASVGPTTSDAQAVHALVTAGLKAVRRKAEELQYDKLAAFLRSDPEHLAWVESRRARRRSAPGEAV
jgi:hypothetical protein